MANSTSFVAMNWKAIFFGKNWRISPFMFSLAPRSHEEYGWAKKRSASSLFAMRSCWANSRPLSAVGVGVRDHWAHCYGGDCVSCCAAPVISTCPNPWTQAAPAGAPCGNTLTGLARQRLRPSAARKCGDPHRRHPPTDPTVALAIHANAAPMRQAPAPPTLECILSQIGFQPAF